ncbi:hypothetical protein LCGC14_1730440, partial [marine sediment metagenome]
LTKFEERVIRLTHHDHQGLTQQEASEKLGVSQACIAQTLSRIRGVAPELFPIMTRHQAYVYELVTKKGMTAEHIAKHMGVSKRAIEQMIVRIKKRGFAFPKRAKKLRFEPWMENQIVKKF